MKILFVCTGNTCRSPMAELIMRDIAEDEGLSVDVDSAGIFAANGAQISMQAAAELKERGIDAYAKRSKRVTEEMVEGADLVLCMGDGHRRMLVESYPKEADKIKTLAEYVGESRDVKDPYGGDYDTYRRCADRIEGLVDKLIKKINAR